MELSLRSKQTFAQKWDRHDESDMSHIPTTSNMRPHQIIYVNKIYFQRIFAHKFTIQIAVDGTVFIEMDAFRSFNQTKRNGTGDTQPNKQIEARKLPD